VPSIMRRTRIWSRAGLDGELWGVCDDMKTASQVEKDVRGQRRRVARTSVMWSKGSMLRWCVSQPRRGSMAVEDRLHSRLY
jgi:hypothetical protein